MLRSTSASGAAPLPQAVRCTGILLVFLMFFVEWLNRYGDIAVYGDAIEVFSLDLLTGFAGTTGKLLIIAFCFMLFEFITVDGLGKHIGDSALNEANALVHARAVVIAGAVGTSAGTTMQLAEQTLAFAKLSSMGVRAASLWLTDPQVRAVYFGVFVATFVASIVAKAWVVFRSGSWSSMVKAGELTTTDKTNEQAVTAAKTSGDAVRAVLSFQLMLMVAGLAWCVAQ
jgi:hypothetical protein